jgi:hypothetical protein
MLAIRAGEITIDATFERLAAFPAKRLGEAWEGGIARSAQRAATGEPDAADGTARRVK